ncbi:MAG TPA: hypothetical protein ENN80_03345 [Candidatus Hydrogenedentes bacterium]|nr:hypothetical protein [Candidatus Hydrogenedentota bacterium]
MADFNASNTPTGINASIWAAQLQHPEEATRARLRKVYGSDAGLLDDRLALLRRVVERFLEQFGDRPVRIFRSPGRINLRGMHVDTHGGYLNLMTHQREVVAALAASGGATFTFANIAPEFPETTFSIAEEAALPGFRTAWTEFIMAPEVRVHIEADRGAWGYYLRGCALRTQHAAPEKPLGGVCGVLGSDLPRGAALSSSAALCLSVITGVLAWNGATMSAIERIVAARDAEWYTGSRCGLSDQAAMVLPASGEVLSIALDPDTPDVSSARRLALPDSVRVLVIHSYTERSLSGAALVAYTRNRFAYSLAMAIMQQELRNQGAPEDIVAGLGSLARLTPEILDDLLGPGGVYALLRRIPESLPLDALRARYTLPGLDEAYERYFGTVPKDERPELIGLRGPLMFALAESQRARAFFGALEEGQIERAGRLMSVGHDGDRHIAAGGAPYAYDVSDAALERRMAEGTPVEMCPGVYGASSPVLDALVDAALEGGALGASLTGAGIAGAVLALCRAEDAERVAYAVRARLSSPGYAALAGLDGPLSAREAAQGVCINRAISPAGELLLG